MVVRPRSSSTDQQSLERLELILMFILLLIPKGGVILTSAEGGADAKDGRREEGKEDILALAPGGDVLGSIA
jgi:hypothetical protein